MLKALKGFTLVELLVVLLILAILASIATPMYLRHVHRARASEAVATLGLIRQAEREHFSQHNSYLPTTDIRTDLDVDVGTAQYFSNAAYSVVLNATGVSGLFTNPNAVDFVITANGNASVSCGGNLTDCAVRRDDVVNYRAEMDNSGRIAFTHDITNSSNWHLY